MKNTYIYIYIYMTIHICRLTLIYHYLTMESGSQPWLTRSAEESLGRDQATGRQQNVWFSKRNTHRKPGKPQENRTKMVVEWDLMIVSWWFNSGLMGYNGGYPLVN